MADIDHSALSGSQLHESKGVDSASTDQVFSADGAGSGSFKKITSDMVDSSSIFNINKRYLATTIEDISTASSHWIVSPVAGTITKIYSVINAAIATSDAALTFELGGVLITGGNITVATSGSAAGTIDSSTPSAANAVTAGQAVECITDGASTNTVKATITIEITLTA